MFLLCYVGSFGFGFHITYTRLKHDFVFMMFLLWSSVDGVYALHLSGSFHWLSRTPSVMQTGGQVEELP